MEHQAFVVAPISFVTCCTQGVVTPNIVRPTSRPVFAGARRGGGVLLASSRARTIPAIACAPFASTCSEIAFRPCTSVTEYIIMISEGPT